MTDQRPTSPPPAPQQAPPPQPAAPQYPPPWWVHPPKRSSFVGRFFRVLLLLLFVLSVLLNIELTVLLAGRWAGGMASSVLDDGKSDQIVAVYAVAGMIDGEAAQAFQQFCRVVRDDKKIKAVVLRIDSGGGGVSASDQIQEAVRAIREKLGKPVVVSMGGVAASGGYYIAAPADEIYAEPTTVTGSIGVIAAWPVLQKLMDKWGIEFVTIRSTHAEDWKAKANFWETPDDKTIKNYKDMLDTMQERFEQVVIAGRGDRLQRAKQPDEDRPAGARHAPFNGKIYTADEARQIGLVDEIGYLMDAANAAARLANLSDPKVVQYSRRPALLTELLAKAETPKLDAKLLDEWSSPRILMLWRP
ncbi:MAG TPA: S49 family peptidase [Phycisphaerae bacterium]|nr:S49 family peptidase [Phycisphaerae bacterium]